MTESVPDLLWWRQLTPAWKQAFAETTFRHLNEPGPRELVQLFEAPALRFAGPMAPYPNMSFELTDLSGLAALTQVQTLVVIFHQIKSLKELSFHRQLRHLFLYNNQLQSLNGIEYLTSLEQLYVQFNQLENIQPVASLVKLRELYVHDNRISSLEVLTEEHAENLEVLVCKPNESLKQKELLRIERELGIRCRGI